MRSQGSRGSRLPGGSAAHPSSSSRPSDNSGRRIVDGIGGAGRKRGAHCSSRARRFPRAVPCTGHGKCDALRSAPAAAPLAGLLTLTVAVVGQSALAGAREVVAHLIEAGPVALTLYRADVGGGERQLQLLRRKQEGPGRGLVFAHVEI